MAKYKLGDIAPIQQGSVPESESYWLLNLDMVESNTGHIYERLYVPFDKIGTSTIAFDTNNVLYSKLRPYLNKVVIPDCPGYATSEMLPLKPNKNYITREYLTYFLRSPKFVAYINEKTSGAKMPRANSSDLKSVEIECPTLENQRHITSEFDRIISIVRLRQQQLQKLDELVKARFIELFGTIHDNRFGFGVVTLQDVSAPIKDGTHQTPTYTTDVENGYKFLSSKDVTTGKVDWSHLKYIPEELHRELYARISPRRGDILLAKNSTTGIAAIVDRDEVFDIYVSLALIRPHGVDPTYLWAAINAAETKQQFDASLKGIGVPNLHLGEIKKARIILPPMELQEQFATFVEQTDKSKVAVQKALDEAQLLFDSLMQKYFG
ncbi:restriction endonuclease subunit S [Butyricicoccus sp. AM29-23AC]|nr:restriction endonuclease subunit S [Butyricicoccus sp. AM29-23AC]